MKEIGPWKTVKSSVAYESPWIKVLHDEVINPAGNPGTYSVVEFKNIAIGVVPVDEKGYTWLVGQHRYPLDEYSWEIPEGGGDPNVDPIESAQRELLEETGIMSSNYNLITTMHLSNSVSNEKAVIYLAQDLVFGSSNPEETEELEIRRIHLNDFFTEVKEGKITDSLTVAAALKLELMMLKGELKLLS